MCKIDKRFEGYRKAYRKAKTWNFISVQIKLGDLKVRKRSYVKVVEIQSIRDMRKPALTIRDTEVTIGSVYKGRLTCLNPGSEKKTRFEKLTSVETQRYIKIKNWERGSDIPA